MKNIGRVLLGSRNFLVATTFVAILMVVSASVAHLQSQTGEANRSRDKVLEIGDDFHAPVKVTLVKSQAKVIRPGEPFSDGEDWFKGLTISVRNDSGKPITYISLRIRFPRPKGQENELDFVELLNYGVSPMPNAAGQVPFNPAKTVLPGEIAELKLSDEDYNDIKMLLKDSKYSSSINKIKVSIMMLGFNDGTVWIGGKTYTPDKNNPGRLIPLEKK